MGRHNASLLVLLPALPANTTRKTLRQFIRKGLSESGYRGLKLAMAVSKCSIIRVTDPANGKSELQGMVLIRPAKAAMDAIEVLHGRRLLGEPVSVRRYRQRGHHGIDAAGDGERRRRDLRVDVVDS